MTKTSATKGAEGMERRSFLKGLAVTGAAIGASGVGSFISKGFAAKKL
jgi:TAT (twin-arginine translocation) pathway signal sequence